jgi:REP element-mobilizing transposase RayT
MADTYVALHYHIVFSTKHREPWITADVEERVWTYLGGIARHYGMTPLKIGGLEDHLHLVVGLSPTLTVSKAVQLLKGGSSRWIRSSLLGFEAFGWQDGYGAFTISQSVLAPTITYVERQRETHRARTFQQEYLALLQRHSIAYDEKHLWD